MVDGKKSVKINKNLALFLRGVCLHYYMKN